MIRVLILLILIALVYCYYNTYEMFGNGYDYDKDYNDNRRSLYEDYKRKMGYLLSYEVKPFTS